MNITEKYYWITEHPACVPFGDTAIIEITPHMVCPETNHIEKLDILNTKLRFWVEFMIPCYDEYNKIHTHSHDWELDCGGDTWEEAVETLYNLVLEKYGDYTDEDLENHRKKAMANFDLTHFINKNNINTIVLSDYSQNIDKSQIEMLPDYEIDGMKNDLEHLETLLPVLLDKIGDKNISMSDYYDVQLEITCVEHDILVLKESIKCGYDVEKYGLSCENSKTN